MLSFILHSLCVRPFRVSCIISSNIVSCLADIFISFNFLSDAGLVLAMQSVYTSTSLLVLLSVLDKRLLGSVQIQLVPSLKCVQLLGYIFSVSSEVFNIVMGNCTDHIGLLIV